MLFPNHEFDVMPSLEAITKTHGNHPYVTHLTYAADLVNATPEVMLGAIDYVTQRAKEDKAYAEFVMEQFDRFDALKPAEKADYFNDEQLADYVQKSHEVTMALLQVVSPLPTSVLPQ